MSTITFNAGILYSRRGWEYFKENKSGSLNEYTRDNFLIQSLELPAVLNYALEFENISPYLTLGFSNNFFLSADHETHSQAELSYNGTTRIFDNKVQYDSIPGLAPQSFEGILGAGIYFKLGNQMYSIDARYQEMLNEVFAEANTSPHSEGVRSIKHINSWRFSIAVAFL